MSATRILVLQASARSDGNTARAARMVEEGLRKDARAAGIAVEIESLDLAKLQIGPCRGCRSCFDRGEGTCPLDDQLLFVKEKMKAADGLVLAGPVYVNDVNGVMKNWIDRMAHVCHRPEFAGKTAMLLATTGATSARHALRTMQVALWTWGYRIACQASFVTGAAMPESELRERYSETAGRAARKLIQDIRDRRAATPSFLSLMVFRIQQAGWRKAAPGSLDFSFWSDKGWLDTRRCSYFFPHRASPLTVAAARLVGSIVAALVT